MIALLVLSVLAECGVAQTDQTAAITAANLPSTVTQVIVVTSDAAECTRGAVSMYAKTSGWTKEAGPFPAVLGRKGMAASDKREGDGKTPMGVYGLGTAFGYAPSVQSAMPYKQTASDDVWVDDPSAPDYNTWVKRRETQATSFEQLRRDDGLYELAVVIAYNTHPVKRGAGSAIFMHVWRAPNKPTAGCVALEKSSLQALVTKLDPARQPQIMITSSRVSRE